MSSPAFNFWPLPHKPKDYFPSLICLLLKCSQGNAYPTPKKQEGGTRGVFLQLPSSSELSRTPEPTSHEFHSHRKCWVCIEGEERNGVSYAPTPKNSQRKKMFVNAKNMIGLSMKSAMRVVKHKSWFCLFWNFLLYPHMEDGPRDLAGVSFIRH